MADATGGEDALALRRDDLRATLAVSTAAFSLSLASLSSLKWHFFFFFFQPGGQPLEGAVSAAALDDWSMTL